MDVNIIRGNSILTGGTTAYLGTLSTGDNAYVHKGIYYVKVNATNTGSVTLNLNSIGIKSIKDNKGSQILSGAFPANSWFALMYDSTLDYFVLLGSIQRNTTTFADAAARTAAVPEFQGQLGTQLDTNIVYEANGTIAGAWGQVNYFEDGAGVGSVKSKNATSAIGNYSTSFGNTCIATGTSSLAIGTGAVARLDNMTSLGGPIVNRKDNGENNTNNPTDNNHFKFAWFSGAMVTLMTEEIDFKTTGSYTISIATGARFYCDSIDVIITTLGGTITAQPFVRAGITGTLAKLLAIVQTTGLTASLFTRQKYDTLLSYVGEADIVAGVTTAATGSSTIKGRFIFKGYLVENQ